MKKNEMTHKEYNAELRCRIGSVFRKHPEIPDHRSDYPWITGFLGNPFSGIWFVGENPSLGTAKKGTNHLTEPPTEELQWQVSIGDKLFRKELVKYGFKKPPLDSPGGWNCYIPDLIKQTEYAGEWRSKNTSAINAAVEAWADVVSWELATSKPKMVVAMGRQVARLVTHLGMVVGIKFPIVRHIKHYSYIGIRPQGTMRAMHPLRVAAYDRQMAEIRKEFDGLK